jgi:hypothetical protein
MQGGLRLTPEAFFCNWFATVLGTLVAQSFGLLIGATVMNAKTAQTVTAVIMLTMMLGAHIMFPGGWLCSEAGPLSIRCGWAHLR